MNSNSLVAYEKLDLPKAERETIEWLAKYGPASQAVLIKCILAEPRFDEQEDAQRVKFGQNHYARLHGLKAKGIAEFYCLTPGQIVDAVALAPVAPQTSLDPVFRNVYPDDGVACGRRLRFEPPQHRFGVAVFPWAPHECQDLHRLLRRAKSL